LVFLWFKTKTLSENERPKVKKTACRLDKVVFSLKLKTKKNWNRRERVLPAAKLFGIPPYCVTELRSLIEVADVLRPLLPGYARSTDTVGGLKARLARALVFSPFDAVFPLFSSSGSFWFFFVPCLRP
jgi:hypothetical protein